MPQLQSPLPVEGVAALLNEIGKRMELTGESPFKTRAYYTAAENLFTLTEPLEDLIARGKLKTIPGVGEAIAEKIIKLHKTGTHPTLEFLREQFPAGVLDLMKIQGLGPKKAAYLYQSLKIACLADLELACRDGKLTKAKGFGEKVQAKILESLAFTKKGAGLLKMDAAHERARAACLALKGRHPGLKEVIAAGSVRRGCEVCGSLELVAVTGASEPAEPIESTAEIRVSIAAQQKAGVALLFATGSAEHLEQLRERAVVKGLALTPEGLWRGNEELPCAEEAEVYAALGLPFIDPELREGRGEIQRAEKGAPPRLIDEKDLRGILHCHTNFSDGSNTLEEMAEATRKLGMQYFGVCDHSQSAAYARGMRFDKVRSQHQLADKLNVNFHSRRFRIFKGIESDILEAGELDYSDAQLAEFDFIVASIHSRFQLNKKEQTSRIVNAVKNPHTTILGHATGRLLLQREGYEVDLEDVLKACADHGVAVEINADPHRLDLDWRWHARALELGCMLAINPDAHDTVGLLNQKWGVIAARKGGVPAERVLNCLDLAGIERHFAERKKRTQKV